MLSGCHGSFIEVFEHCETFRLVSFLRKFPVELSDISDPWKIATRLGYSGLIVHMLDTMKFENIDVQLGNHATNPKFLVTLFLHIILISAI